MIDTTWLKEHADKVRTTDWIEPSLYNRFNVKRGLRNADGTGVLVGLTSIGSVHGYVVSENEKMSVPGQLFYRGIDVYDLVNACREEHRFGFEEAVYLLLFGKLPTAEQLAVWERIMGEHHRLPDGFKENAIIQSPGKDIMNSIARAVLMGYTYDPSPDLLDIETCLRQSIELIAGFPTIAAYAYQAKAHYHLGRSLTIRYPDPEKSTAENFLALTREDGKYTRLEAELLDLALVLHAEHGGGNNSSFTTHVVTSSFTDTYSSIAAATLSLKGSRHGGANLRVQRQMQEMKEAVKDWHDRDEIAAYIEKIFRKEAGDGTGLVYGMGHAVYTLSDPRAVMLKAKAAELAKVQSRLDEFSLIESVEELTPTIFEKVKGRHRDICANVDLYSGFVYDMLGIPTDLYTPLFAVARVAGWCAHRMEELINSGPIIRPAYKSVNKPRGYVRMSERDGK